MTREEIIERLRALEIDASPRDWAMGKTVVVPLGTPAHDRGIRLWPGVLYLRPEQGGHWQFCVLDQVQPEPPESLDELDALVRQVAKIHAEWATRTTP